jgi:hypothetical protein
VTAGGDEDRAAAATDLAAALTLADETGAAIYAPFIHEERGRLHGDERSLHQALRLFSAAGAGGHARRLEAELAAAGRTTER